MINEATHQINQTSAILKNNLVEKESSADSYLEK